LPGFDAPAPLGAASRGREKRESAGTRPQFSAVSIGVVAKSTPWLILSIAARAAGGRMIDHSPQNA
jgi:hypothetical protein